LIGFAQTFGAEAWLTDFKEAQAKAGELNRPIVALFTGSDWCPPCMRLHKEVTTKSEFLDYAAKNVVLLEVDFPMKKKQSEEQKKTNHELEEKYGVEGYPTMVVIQPSGKESGKVDFAGEDAKEFIAKLDKTVKKAASKS
jgi:thioredoxin-related protein